MRRIIISLAAGLCAGLFGLYAPAQAAADMSLTRLDCSTPQAPIAGNERFSDTFSYGDLKIQFVYSCYLIKHGDQYLLWDTGHCMTALNVAPKVSIVDQLDKIGVKPEQITYVGISHYHADHTGQVASFPKATLLIGLGDWNAITAPKPAAGVNFAPFEGWIKGDNKVEPQPNDKDVFGDGSVIMLNTPIAAIARAMKGSAYAKEAAAFREVSMLVGARARVTQKPRAGTTHGRHGHRL